MERKQARLNVDTENNIFINNNEIFTRKTPVSYLLYVKYILNKEIKINYDWQMV